MRLQNKIILYFLLVGIIPLVIITGYFLVSVEDRIRSTSHQALISITSEVCREVQRTVNEGYNSIHLLAENPVILSSTSTREEIQEELSKISRFYPIIKDISLVSPQGNTIASARYSFRGSWGASSWLQRGVNGETLISDVHALIYPYEVVMTVVVPVFENAVVRDVLIGHIDMKPVQEIVESVSYGQASDIILIDQRGYVVASSSDSSELLRPVSVPLLERAVKTDATGIINFSNGRNMVAAVLAVDDPESERVVTGWYLALMQSEDEAYHVASSIKGGILFTGLFALAMVVILSMLLGKPITRRIRVLADSATDLGTGNYRLINDPGKDELSELGRAFNRASEQLRESEQKLTDYQQNLKKLVEQRTRELQASNRALLEEIEERKQIESDRSRLQEQLLHSQKMEAVGKLAGGIAHDFNNLLQAISGYTQLLLRDKNPEQSDYSRLKTIEKTTDRAGQLVQKLLLFSRKAPVQTNSLNLNHEIENCAKLLERTIPKMVHISLNLDTDIRSVHADPVQVEQVLLNLGINAADSMPDGGTILFETRNFHLDHKEDAADYPDLKPGDYVLVVISDNGAGMDKQTMSRMFEPFFTTKEVGKGTGLGLASVYGIIQGHKGRVFCQSEPGKGTSFKLFWPVADGTVEKDSSTDPKAEIVHNGDGLILVVDDEPDILELVSELLQSFDYLVETASTGEEALKIFKEKKNSIDLLILDLNMPGMGGYKCMQEILMIDPQARILITSGYASNLMGKNDLIKSGAAGYLRKPYQISELLALISKALG